MESIFESNYVVIYILILLGVLALYVAIALAILKLPQIKKNTDATMKIMALMAKKQGVDPEMIVQTLKEADHEIFLNNKRLENELSK